MTTENRTKRRHQRLLPATILALLSLSPVFLLLQHLREHGLLAQTSHLAAYAVFGCLIAGLSATLLRTRSRHTALVRESRTHEKIRRQLQSDLEDSRRRFHQVLANAGDAIFFIDPADGSLQLSNRQAEEIIGYSCDEVRTLALATLFPGGQKRRYLRLVRRVLRTGYGEEPNLQFRRKDGCTRVGAVHARLGTLGTRQVVHGVVRDVTRVRHHEQELRRRNRELTLLNDIAHRVSGSLHLGELLLNILGGVIEVFETEGGGIFLLREDGRELQLAAHQGVEAEVLADIMRVPIGPGLAGRVAASGHPHTSGDLQKDIRLRSDAIRQAGWRGFQAVPLVAKEKTVGVLFLYTRTRRLPEHSEQDLLLAIGRQVGTAIESARLFEDLQWQNRLTRASNRELQRSRLQLRENLDQAQQVNLELERLDRMKSSFLSLASHELRTPLTCVLSGIQFLHQTLMERLQTEERLLLDAVLHGGERLERVVRDLLEAARLESNALYLAREQVDLAELLEAIREEFSATLQDRELSLILPGLPDRLAVTGDAYHLKRTFARLIENAIKFTPSGGGIEVRVTQRQFAEVSIQKPELSRFSPDFFHSLQHGPLLQVTIRDTGIGIPLEEQVRVFDKFYEIGDIADHTSSRSRFGGKGVGLGLTLVKGIVEAHEGMVWVESSDPERGAGSSFHILLPVTSEEAELHG